MPKSPGPWTLVKNLVPTTFFAFDQSYLNVNTSCECHCYSVWMLSAFLLSAHTLCWVTAAATPHTSAPLTPVASIPQTREL